MVQSDGLGLVNTPNPPTNVDLPLRLLVQFQQRYPESEPELVLQAPGRDLWAMATLSDSGRFVLDSVELNARTQFSVYSARGRQTVLHRPLPKWACYAAGVAVHLADANFTIGGLKLVVGGDEPPGPRYDYTLGVLMAVVLFTLHEESFTNTRLIDVTDRARREYVEVI